jgi:hypothetical protein
MVQDVLNVIPRLRNLRRVPRKYWYCIPLNVMKRHQCIVIGGEPGVLTVAVADCRRTCIFTYLRLLTGCAIFPVQVDSARINLFIKRVERSRSVRYDLPGQSPLYHPLAIRAMLTFFRISSVS